MDNDTLLKLKVAIDAFKKQERSYHEDVILAAALTYYNFIKGEK